MRRSSITLVAGLATATLLSLAQTTYAQSISVYLSGPADTDTFYTSQTVGTTFETFPTGRTDQSSINSSDFNVPGFATYHFSSSSIGTIEDPTDGINTNNDQYGNNTGKYLGLGNYWNGGAGNQSVTVDLAFSSRYFGIAWTAGDSGNVLSFYSGNLLLATYITSNTTAVLTSGPTINPISGPAYNTADYYGQPVTHANASEPYTYLNFFATNATFDRVVLGNVNTGTGFEMDNHRISAQTLTPQGAFVLVETLSIVPEADSGTLVGIALAGTAMVGLVRRRLRK